MDLHDLADGCRYQGQTEGVPHDGVIRWTDRAALINFDGEEKWIPRSQIVDIDHEGVILTQWFARKEGLV